MKPLIFLALILLCISIFLVLVRKKDFAELKSILTINRKKTFKDEFNDKRNPIIDFFSSSQYMLKATGSTNKFYIILILSCALIFTGAFMGILIGNIYLVPVLAICFSVIPFIYVRMQFISYNKLVLEELSNAMGAVTTSYERTENILLAFKENIDDTKEPVKTIFQAFVNEIEHINPNYEKAIDNMKRKIDSSVWIEWCEALKRCSQNRSIKYVLAPIVTKLSKINVVLAQLQNILGDAVKDFATLVLASIALLYVGIYVLPSGLMIVIPEDLSNILIALNLGVATFLSLRVMLITKDVNFDL
ncbi:MAG: hypothetical protein R3Y33_01825 [Clostridia bacterium]